MATNNYDAGKQPVVLTGQYIRESEKAVCVSLPDETGKLKSHWLPKSQFIKPSILSDDVAPDSNAKHLTCFVPRWLAEKNGLHHADYDEEVDYESGEVSGAEEDDGAPPVLDFEPDFEPEDDKPPF